jgi:DNA-directed RNA polymerase specialized sigma24 family protein
MGDVISIRPWPGSGSSTEGQPASFEGEPRATSDVRLDFLAHEPALRRRALRLARMRDAEHLVRDTFDRLLRSDDEAARGECLPIWLFSVMGKLFVERSGRRPTLVREEPESPAPVTPPRWALTTPARFAAALDLLPPDLRRVFVRHALHGLSYDQIALELRTTRLAVFARLVRARLLLKDMLTDVQEGEGDEQRYDGGV